MLFLKDILSNTLFVIWKTFNNQTKAGILNNFLIENPTAEIWIPLEYHVGRKEKQPTEGLDVITREDILISNLGGVVRTVDLSPVTLSSDKDGYLFFRINIGPYKDKAFRVHRAVACSFIPKTEALSEFQLNYLEVNHINGDKGDPIHTNLEWTTSSGNIKHAYDTLLHTQPKGLNNTSTKPVVGTVIKEGPYKGHRFVLYGKKEIKELGFDGACISECCNGKQKTHRGCTWEFSNYEDLLLPPSKELLKHVTGQLTVG